MIFKKQHYVKVILIGVSVLITAATFAAYLKPGMLVEFANLVLCY